MKKNSEELSEHARALRARLVIIIITVFIIIRIIIITIVRNGQRYCYAKDVECDAGRLNTVFAARCSASSSSAQRLVSVVWCDVVWRGVVWCGVYTSRGYNFKTPS